MTNDKIIRFNPNGPKGNGLQDWDPIDPAELEDGTPVQRGHLYHEDAATGYMAGVWDCTAMTEKFGPYAVNEFMYLLEGSVTMVLEDGKEVTINAGEAFIIPKGLPCQWKQEGYVRKYFTIFENPGAPAAEDVSSLGIILPTPAGPAEGMLKNVIEDASRFIGEIPTQHNHTYYADPSNQFICGLWDSTPFTAPAAPLPQSELMIILEGAVTLTDKNSNEYFFKAGDTAYVPKGAIRGWKSTEYIRKFYCLYDPA
jgi:uncharacterized cupin superfamily protein